MFESPQKVSQKHKFPREPQGTGYLYPGTVRVQRVLRDLDVPGLALQSNCLPNYCLMYGIIVVYICSPSSSSLGSKSYRWGPKLEPQVGAPSWGPKKGRKIWPQYGALS